VSNAHNASLTSSVAARVRVHAVNDAPVLQVPGQILTDGSITAATIAPNATAAHAGYNPQVSLLTEDMLSPVVVDVLAVYTPESTPVQIAGVSVRDVDCSTQSFLMVTLSAVHGSVSLTFPDADIMSNNFASPAVTGLTMMQGTGVNDTTTVFLGSIAAINAALSVLTFTPEPFYYGFEATLVVTVQDLGNVGVGGPKADSQSVRVVVTPVNNPPVVQVPGDVGGSMFYQVNEGSSVKISGAHYHPPPPPLLNADGSLSLPDSGSNLGQTGFEPWRFVEPAPSRAPYNVSVAGWFEWGLRKYADVRAGTRGSFPRFFHVYNGSMYYQADDGVHGPELWVDTGAPDSAGSTGLFSSTLFADLMPGPMGAAPAFLHTHNGVMYFAAAGIDTTWMPPPGQRDACGSFRQSTFDARVSFAVSQNTTWMPRRAYDCPVGYHWASTAEGYALFTSPTDNNANEASAKTYAGQCGWLGDTWQGQTRKYFRF
jgi:hypothetical protein